ncbi:RhuM family protein [Desulforapulum autotrophicum]|nr:RhuM family protein [Desulforapulum autotrophicum]
MAELFQTTQQNISQHVLNIYEEEELAPEATHKKFLSVRLEGKREVKRILDYYNLDMIISVGYRVKSHVATRFRFIKITQRLRQGGQADRNHQKEREKRWLAYSCPLVCTRG